MRAIMSLALMAVVSTALVADESVQADLLGEALASVEKIEAVHLKTLRLADLGAKLAIKGRATEALQAFGSAVAMVSQIEVLPKGEVDAKIAIRMAQGGLFAQAQAQAKKMPSAVWRGVAQAETATLMARAGQVAAATALARSIDHHDFRAQALSDVAMNSGRSSEIDFRSMDHKIENYRRLYEAELSLEKRE